MTPVLPRAELKALQFPLLSSCGVFQPPVAPLSGPAIAQGRFSMHSRVSSGVGPWHGGTSIQERVMGISRRTTRPPGAVWGWEWKGRPGSGNAVKCIFSLKVSKGSHWVRVVSTGVTFR